MTIPYRVYSYYNDGGQDDVGQLRAEVKMIVDQSRLQLNRFY
jgi:poly(3-hydroxybutyrate) depolymerase